MALNERFSMAVSAMKAIGIPEKRVRPVLKNLLKVYDKNWELIEDENYRVLADAIFEYQENEEEEAKRNKEAQSHDDSSGPPLKRMRLRKQDDQASPSGETVLRRTKIQEADPPDNSLRKEKVELSQSPHRGRSAEHEPSSQASQRDKQKKPASPQALSRPESAEPSELFLKDKRADHNPVSPQAHFRDKGKELVFSSQICHGHEITEQSHLHSKDTIAESDSVSSQSHLRVKDKETVSSHMANREKGALSMKSSSAVCFKEPKVEPGIFLLPKEKLKNPQQHDALIKPKSEPFTDGFPQFEVPIAIMHPTNSGHTSNEDPMHKDGCSTTNGSFEQVNFRESVVSDNKHDDDKSGRACKTGTSLELANVPETSSSFELASSPLGEVKISLSCNQAFERPDFHMPNLDEVLKAVEDKCLRSYKILEPNFSMMKLMKEVCQCFLDLSTDSSNSKQESFVHLTSDLDFLKKSNLQNALGAKGDRRRNFRMPASLSDGSFSLHTSAEVVLPKIPRMLPLNGLDSHPNQKAYGKTIGEKDTEGSNPNSSNSHSLVVVPQQNFTIDEVRPPHDVNDISKGEEIVRISLINEVSSESYPPSFYYIPRNIVYQNAYVNFSLARIGDEDCCSNCFGDCLSSSLPCACARETGGEFAYTLEGLIKERFLDECISMNRDPQQHRHYYCKDCPLERSKNENSSEPCKGHLVRKFIKECWSKCGCNKQCGNRVVQRGITCNLQVFLTTEGKGWGLRTLEDLPRGTFVCEYVGEILTNTELYERNMRSTGNEKHTYPVLLDADWGSEGVLKDEEALCLDATFYGNVARFINHRCFDATLVEIPVEVETPDHHYYHLAFFTTRKVDALEELTWDYGIDFDDHDHPVKAFRCRCGSKCCRDMKRSHKTKSRRLL